MQEALLHYIWKCALLEPKEYLADSGEKIRIIFQGVHNTDAGPDFTQAKIEIDDTLWVGNIEIHRQSSDWYRHGHQTDSAYNNVILHVVLIQDKVCRNSSGRRIPSVIIEPDTRMAEKYRRLMYSERIIPCVDELQNLNISRLHFWLSAQAIDRLHAKTEAVNTMLKSTNNSWEETFYIHLACSFGLKINALPFELLARSLPLKIINQEPGKRLRAEALFFGQAGFLEGKPIDNYHSDLKEEYKYLCSKYKLTPIDNYLWKFLRSRPANFPTVRIAQLCNLFTKSTSLFSKLLEFTKLQQVVDFFSCQVNEYWKNHYTFGNKSAFNEKKLGRGTINLIIINTVVPFLFLYGNKKNNTLLKNRAIEWLEELHPERNRITKIWEDAGVIPRHAADSQALIQLTDNYCNQKNCLNCQIGHMLFKNTEHEATDL